MRNRFIAVAMSAGGVSALVHLLAFGRQVMIAGFFGIAREFDVYVVLYAIATFVVFTMATIFDTVTVPHLVRMREERNEADVKAFGRRVLIIGVLLGISTTALFLVATPLLTPIIATGFAPQDRAQLTQLMGYFMPWTLICAPYYACAAWLKANWQFGRVLFAEIVVVVVSIVVLALWHDSVHAIPVAFGAGYAVATMMLVPTSLLVGHAMPFRAPAVRALFRNMGELYGANLSGSVGSLIDRHIQSFIPGGGIAAVNYSAQLVNGLSTVLMFREIFVVPLVREEGRSERLERLISGLVLISVPIAGFVGCFAHDIVAVLFERGRFDKVATDMTASVLRINAILVVFAVVLTPLARIFQIADRIHFAHLMYGSSALSLAVFGYLFVVILDLGLPGVAWMQVAASAVSVVVTAHLVSRCGSMIGWRAIAGYFVIGLVASALAYAAASLSVSALHNLWLRLLIGGASYGAVVAGVYLLAQPHLRTVLFGKAQRNC